MRDFKNKVNTYYQLTKPGIIYGNLMTAAAGFLLASKKDIDFGSLLLTLTGIALVIGGACVINNYLDRGLDKKMTRTKKRALVSGAISPKGALIYAVILEVVGFFVLARFTNALTVYIGLIGFADYVFLYAVGKRRSTLGTIIGSVSGAMPLVAGYTAVTGRFDGGALILFLIMTFWQMPHFYAITLRRFKDYKAAGLPVLPVKKGARITKIEILAYVAAFTGSVIALSLYHYTGWIFAVVMTLLGLRWFYMGIKGFSADNDEQWGKKMFLFSLIVLLVMSLLLSFNVWLI